MCAEGPRITNELKRSLFDSLGYYELDEKTHVSLPRQREKAYVEATVFHENTHLLMFGCTSFGMFQKLLALILLRVPTLSTVHRRHIEHLLDISLKESRLVHEGVATFCQVHYLKLLISEEVAQAELSKKPRDYQHGCKVIGKIVDALDLSLLTRDDAAKALAECALDTDIVESLGRIWHPDDTCLEDSMVHKSPDDRLNRLSSFVTSSDHCSELRQSIVRDVMIEFEGKCLLSRPVDDRDRPRVFSTIRKCVSALVFDVYDLPESPEQLLQWLNQMIYSIKLKGLQLGYREFDQMNGIFSDTLEAEGDVSFERKYPDKGSIVITSERVSAESLKTLLELHGKVDFPRMSYLHIMDPFIGGQRLGFREMAKAADTDDVLVMNPVDTSSWLLSAQDAILHVGTADMISIVSKAPQANTILVSSFSYFRSDQPQESREILDMLSKHHTLFLYLRTAI